MARPSGRLPARSVVACVGARRVAWVVGAVVLVALAVLVDRAAVWADLLASSGDGWCFWFVGGA
ncbi:MULTISPECIES: hypothetical protein [Rhodococcus]|uniref:hypothetical protein n=1 Tax=Rhodococcus TaxID=1827 RepID=UPI001214F395|nr:MULTISPECIES: hypothetical protein [Rhodococcus]QXW04780.1 hypothetical protein KYT97_12610 [Rhodococcus globerulus]RZL26329.1 MAG: hypothetical protein EOP31_07230 [Rhodococcus sp. (in: high G+C Gram-positive bacteria)]